jgi:hypothetical protein
MSPSPLEIAKIQEQKESLNISQYKLFCGSVFAEKNKTICKIFSKCKFKSIAKLHLLLSTNLNKSILSLYLRGEKLSISEVRKNRLGPQIANPQITAFVEDPPIEQICGFSYKKRPEISELCKKIIMSPN